jgi:L-cystine uptake protein TcyP (sodium:dicarboxylate symporter family)
MNTNIPKKEKFLERQKNITSESKALISSYVPLHSLVPQNHSHAQYGNRKQSFVAVTFFFFLCCVSFAILQRISFPDLALTS